LKNSWKVSKHHEIVSNNDDDSMSIESTKKIFNFGQNNSTDKFCLDNNYNNNNDEISDPFSKRIKLKHEPQLKKINQYNILQTLL
jgi:hypothetical protein